jgi:protein arginine N-methyltransferase 1
MRMYTVLDYGRMAMDGVRMDAYERALARAITPGCVVLDIGAGTGIFSLFAARAGARVHAVDPSPAILLVDTLARENGLSDRITVHKTSSLELELPERADVVVADLRGNLPVLEPNIEVLRDARKRLMKPGGTMLPLRDRLFVAVVDSEDLAARLARGHRAFERLGFQAKAVAAAVVNAVYPDATSPLRASEVLTNAASWATIDYTSEGTTDVIEGSASLTARRGGTAVGLALWFEATIAEGIAFDTAPGSELVYGRTFLPLEAATRIAAGDTIDVTLRVDINGKRWAWDTTIAGKAKLRQATFLGTPTDPASLLRASSAFKPTLSAKGERMRRLLAAMDGTKSSADLAKAVGEPLDQVRDAVERYAR